MRIRSATESDEAAIVGLWRTCELVVGYNDPAQDFRFALANIRHSGGVR